MHSCSARPLYSDSSWPHSEVTADCQLKQSSLNLGRLPTHSPQLAQDRRPQHLPKWTRPTARAAHRTEWLAVHWSGHHSAHASNPAQAQPSRHTVSLVVAVGLIKDLVAVLDHSQKQHKCKSLMCTPDSEMSLFSCCSNSCCNLR